MGDLHIVNKVSNDPSYEKLRNSDKAELCGCLSSSGDQNDQLKREDKTAVRVLLKHELRGCAVRKSTDFGKMRLIGKNLCKNAFNFLRFSQSLIIVADLSQPLGLIDEL